MCIDFTGLNKHCPKDPFALPRIDQIIDSTAGSELLSEPFIILTEFSFETLHARLVGGMVVGSLYQNETFHFFWCLVDCMS